MYEANDHDRSEMAVAAQTAISTLRNMLSQKDRALEDKENFVNKLKS